MNAPVANPPRHFLDISDHDSATLRALIDDAKKRKAARRGLSRGQSDADRPLDGRVLAMIFDKQSTRTRISFDMAARQLGGTTLMLTGNEMQLAREETVADTARVLSRYVDAVMIRLLDHEMVEELAANASIPVINGLTKWSHPCQVMADVMTYEEHKGPHRRGHGGLERRQQQCADQLGACGGEVRFQAACRIAKRTWARPGTA